MTSQFIIYGLVDPRDGQLRYESCHDAARKLGTSAGSVSATLHGKQKSSRGRTFKFLEQI